MNGCTHQFLNDVSFSRITKFRYIVLLNESQAPLIETTALYFRISRHFHVEFHKEQDSAKAIFMRRLLGSVTLLAV
jgi:hypothetical protein